MGNCVLLIIYISKKSYPIKMFVDLYYHHLSSCGDDGRIRGWNWKEILDSEVSMQGNLYMWSNYSWMFS